MNRILRKFIGNYVEMRYVPDLIDGTLKSANKLIDLDAPLQRDLLHHLDNAFTFTAVDHKQEYSHSCDASVAKY